MNKTRKVLNYIIFIVIFCNPLVLFSDTNVSGTQTGTWDLAGSPYFVTGDITIPASNSLTIYPGVSIEMQGDYQITAEGYLIVEGTEADSIKFYGQAKSTWQGIRLEDETNQSTFYYCRISDTDGTNARGIHSLNSPVSIQHCYFDNHRKAVNFSAMDEANPSYMEILDSYITNCEQCGILVNENSNVLINNCEITQCGLGASYWPGIQLSLQNSTGECNPTITNNHIHHNGKQGLTMANLFNYGEMAPDVESNIIEYNLTGVYLYNAQGYYKNNIIQYNFILGNPNSGAGVMLYGSGTNGIFVENEVTGNFTGFYCMENATSNLGDLGNFDPTDDGLNHIHDNEDESGTVYSFYNMSAMDIKAENNTWDSNDYGEIAQTIIDGNDNPAYGIVDFDPICPGVSIDPQQQAVLIFNGNQPNPFTQTTRFSYSLSRPSEVGISIYNLIGQKVTTLESNYLSSGNFSVEWGGTDTNNRNLPSGVYLYTISVNGHYSNSGKCLLIR